MGILKRVSSMAVIMMVPAMLYAQFNNNTTSPYSRFGLGDLHRGTTARSAAMGGAVLGSRNSLQINLANPASYTAVDSLSFLFDFGFQANFSNFKNNISSINVNNVNFNYFEFGFPVTRWLGAGMGLMPYSDSGYDLRMTEDDKTFGQVWHRYHGEGSLSRAYFGLGLEPVKNISLGVNLYYFFGKLTRYGDVDFLDALDFYNDQKYEQIRLRDFGLSYGLQATLPLSDKKQVTLGLTLEDKPVFTAFHSNVTRKILSNGSTAASIDTIVNIIGSKDRIQMPLSFGAGLSYVVQDKLELNADYIHQGWSKATFFGKTDPDLSDLDRVAVGAEYIPNKFSIRSYFDKIAFRAGLCYENYYLTLDGEQLNDVGISFGVGLPIYRSLSVINISAEFGRRGNTRNNLIRENYARFKVSVNLFDNWFIKRKFD